MAKPKTSKQDIPQPPPYEIREDKTLKAQGYFGPIKNVEGTPATEISLSGGIPMSKPFTHEDDLLYPSIVPGMTKEQLESQLAGQDLSPELDDMAWRHARERLKAGKSPFATPGEQYPFPGYEDQFMKQYPGAVMSYPNRTVGYQYAAGAPVTPFMSPVASRPVPVEPNMSLATAVRAKKQSR